VILRRNGEHEKSGYGQGETNREEKEFRKKGDKEKCFVGSGEQKKEGREKKREQ